LHPQLQQIENDMALTYALYPLSSLGKRRIKRCFDIVVSLLFACTLFPILFVVIGIIIKLNSKGPIIFKQERNGKNGKVFKCYKFRSMETDSKQLIRFGHFMRRTHIDEFPQFVNVLKGDMSIVGPRPHMVEHTKEYTALIEEYTVRLLVKPGITGWAQIKGYVGDIHTLEDMKGRVKEDIWYIENWSFLLDLKIILRTTLDLFHKNRRKT